MHALVLYSASCVPVGMFVLCREQVDALRFCLRAQDGVRHVSRLQVLLVASKGLNVASRVARNGITHVESHIKQGSRQSLLWRAVVCCVRAGG
jgi:hypothetical protein